MKRKLKGFVFMLCMVLGFSIFASASVLAAELSAEEIESYETSAKALIESLGMMSGDELEANKAQTSEEVWLSAFESLQSSKEELGDFVEVISQESEVDGEELTIVSQVAFEKATATVPLVLEITSSAVNIVSFRFDVNYTKSQMMGTAGLNTLMGLGIVFCMLVFLSLVISQFKHFNKLEAWLAKKSEARALRKTQKVAGATTPAPVVQKEAAPQTAVPAVANDMQEELVNDAELVAVIAAAIAAAEGTSVDGFRVRSIRRAGTRKWKNA